MPMSDLPWGFARGGGYWCRGRALAGTLSLRLQGRVLSLPARGPGLWWVVASDCPARFTPSYPRASPPLNRLDGMDTRTASTPTHP